MAKRRRASQGEEQRIEYALLDIDTVYGGVISGRADMGDPTLVLLAASIARHGLLQPILVRKSPQRDRYVLVSGARRLQACRMAGLRTVHALIVQIGEQEAVACCMEEHLTHCPPHFLAEAAALRRSGLDGVKQHFALPQELLDERFRMLALCEAVRGAISRQGLTLSQAQPLLEIGDASKQLEAASIIAQRGLSGAQARRLICGPQRLCEQPGRRRALSGAVAAINQTIERLRAKGVQVQLSMHSQEQGICIQLFLKNPEVLGQSAGNDPASAK